MNSTTQDPYERIRAICVALPEVTERDSHGEATWFVGKRVFVTSADRHHDDRRAVWIAASDGVQESLVELAPDRFFRPPYVGSRGWLGVYLDVPVDWDELAAQIVDAYRLIAPRGLAALV
ncbi:MAG: hypothetical protein K0S97_617 [Chloroflexota bacterium]|nr:hypothetical protein [Chloroflexota bacterium]